MRVLGWLGAVVIVFGCDCLATAEEQVVFNFARSGPWSSAATWEGGRVPGLGARVLIKKTFRPTLRDGGQTEERLITAIDGDKLTLDKPLEFDHAVDGEYRGDVANLSRNVVVESAQPEVARGHMMYHKYSQGSISYAEFRYLGKEGVLGRYSLHFHLCGDTMRGASVIGASIWDSGNRWLTIHGTNYLVVRDCVGYKSVGHGYFLEDGTEVYNVLDRNLAVQAFLGKPLPNRCSPTTRMTARASGGPTATTRLPATSPPSATSTAIFSRR